MHAFLLSSQLGETSGAGSVEGCAAATPTDPRQVLSGAATPEPRGTDNPTPGTNRPTAVTVATANLDTIAANIWGPSPFADGYKSMVNASADAN
jgi:hypothetical protein